MGTWLGVVLTVTPTRIANLVEDNSQGFVFLIFGACTAWMTSRVLEHFTVTYVREMALADTELLVTPDADGDASVRSILRDDLLLSTSCVDSEERIGPVMRLAHEMIPS